MLATAPTIEHIQATKDLKLAYWGPILDGAPKALVVPKPLEGDSLELEGQHIQVIGLDSADPAHTSLWVPSLRTQLGGVLVSGNMHVWTADSQSAESRRNWIAALDRIEAQKPEQVIPGHYLGERAAGLDDLRFTRDYLKALEQELPKAKDAAALIAAMKKRYPAWPARPTWSSAPRCSRARCSGPDALTGDSPGAGGILCAPENRRYPCPVPGGCSPCPSSPVPSCRCRPASTACCRSRFPAS